MIRIIGRCLANDDRDVIILKDRKYQTILYELFKKKFKLVELLELQGKGSFAAAVIDVDQYILQTLDKYMDKKFDGECSSIG